MWALFSATPPSHPTCQFLPPPSPKATALGIPGTTTLVGHRCLAWRCRRCRRPPRRDGRRDFRRTVRRRKRCLPSRAPRRAFPRPTARRTRWSLRSRGRSSRLGGTNGVHDARLDRGPCGAHMRCRTARCARRRGGEPAHERAAELALTRPPATIDFRRRVVLGGAWSSAARNPRRCAALAAAVTLRRPGRAPLRAALGTGAVLLGAVRHLRRATSGQSGRAQRPRGVQRYGLRLTTALRSRRRRAASRNRARMQPARH